MYTQYIVKLGHKLPGTFVSRLRLLQREKQRMLESLLCCYRWAEDVKKSVCYFVS